MKPLVFLVAVACTALSTSAQNDGPKFITPFPSPTLPLPGIFVSSPQTQSTQRVAETSSADMAGTRNFYVSSSSGDDSRSVSQAQNPATPWRSLRKINAYFKNLLPGDAVLLKRGDTFYEPLLIGKSGTPQAPIIVSAFGTGPKPIINGFRTLKGWTFKGNGIYESKCTSCKPQLNTVIINGIIRAKGRYPNPSAPNKGYLSWESHSGDSSITDTELTAEVNWTGGEVVTRKEQWNIDKNPITRHNGSTINYIPQSSYPTYDGWGYFIQNHPATLDEFGEWYFNPSTKNLQIYFGTSPESYTIRASVLDTLVNLNRKNYVTIDNISINGADKVGLQLDNTNGVVIQNCDINNSGIEGINGEYTYNLSLLNNTVQNSLCNGINLVYYAYGDIIRGNVIKNTGLFPGMARSGDGTYCGIQVYLGKNNLIEYNEVDSSGYIGIGFYCDSILIKNNLVNYFDLTKQDGGGIYACAHNNGDPINKYGKRIIGNIVLNGIGIPEGTNNPNYIPSDGIYLDNRNTKVDILDNTVAYCAQSGVFNHESNNLTITGNTFFNNAIQVLMNQGTSSPNDPMRNNIVKNNIAYSNNNTQFNGVYRSSQYDVGQFGSFDSNYYAKPDEGNNVFNTVMNGEFKYHSFSDWRSTFSNYDTQSTFSLVRNLRFEYNASTGTKTVELDGTYIDPRKNSYTDSVTLLPYTSIILMKASEVKVETASPQAGRGKVAPDTSGNSPGDTLSAALSAAFNLTVYPNPATQFITLTNTGEKDGNIRLTIYDALGRNVQTQDLVKKGTLTANIDVHLLDAGVYFLELSTLDGKSVTKSFVKQ